MKAMIQLKRFVSLVLIVTFTYEQALFAGDLSYGLPVGNEKNNSGFMTAEQLADAQARQEEMIRRLETCLESKLGGDEADSEWTLQEKTGGAQTLEGGEVATSAGTLGAEAGGAIVNVMTAAGDRISYEDGLMKRVERADGTVLEGIEYDAAGALLSAVIHTPDGGVMTVEGGVTRSYLGPDGVAVHYDGNGRIEWAVAADGLVSAYSYIFDADGAVMKTTVTSPDSITEYGADGKILKAVKTDGTVIEYSGGIVTSIVSTDGTFLFNEEDSVSENGDDEVIVRLSSYTDKDNNSFWYSQGELDTIDFADGSWAYNIDLRDDGSVLNCSIIDSQGAQILISGGAVAWIDEADGDSIGYERAEGGEVNRINLRTAAGEELIYDRSGALMQRTLANGTRYDYANGLITAQTSANGAVAAYIRDYDALARPIRMAIRDAAGKASTYLFDTAGNVIGLGFDTALPSLSPFSGPKGSLLSAQGYFSSTGITTTDGTYLYVKRWGGNLGSDTFEKIGTGYNGTVAGKNYGTLASSTVSYSATYYSDGYLYNPLYTSATSLEKINVATGAKTTMTIASGLLERSTGKVRAGYQLITSDGRYIYNIASHIDNGSAALFNGWTVKVYDPQNAWAVVKQFTAGTTSYDTRGIVSDGKYLYAIQYANTNAARVTKIDLTANAVAGSYVINQLTTNAVNGQFDWVNRKFWLGTYAKGDLYRYNEDTVGYLPLLATATAMKFTPESVMNTTGVLATNGTYYYTKRWGTVSGTSNFVKIGTGYNGTIAGKNYGTLASSTVSYSATYYSDGYLYNPLYASATSLEKINVVTGAKTTMNIASGLLERSTGKVQTGYQLITSDGRYIYNVAYHINNGGAAYNGWTVKVYDPQSNWSVVKQYTVGTSSFYTDGIISDGVYLYFIEWTGTNSARVTASRIADGAIVKTWVVNQAETTVINGQYDWVNNRIVLGTYSYNGVFASNGFIQKTNLGTIDTDGFARASKWALLDQGMVDPSIDIPLPDAATIAGRTQFKELIYGADRVVKKAIKYDGSVLEFKDGLVDRSIDPAGIISSYGYDYLKYGALSELVIDRNGIKRIYDRYGNLKTLSLDGVTQIRYENGAVKEIERADGTKIKNMTFTQSGELDSALIAYPDGSMALYDDAELLQMIGASGSSVDTAGGKIRRIALGDGSIYDWSYSGNDIAILDRTHDERRTYCEGRLLLVEQLTGARLATRYTYDAESVLTKSEIMRDQDVLYTYTYTYETGFSLIHDQDGNTQAYTNDKRLAYLIDSNGRKYVYRYVSESGDYFEIAEVDGTVVRYAKNEFTSADGALVKDAVFSEAGGVNDLVYVQNGKTTRIEDGHIASVTDAQGMTTEYYANGFVKSITLADETKSSYDYEVYAESQPAAKGTFTHALIDPGKALSLDTYADPHMPLLLHANGVDGAKTFTDSSYAPHAMTLYDNTHLGIADKVFGQSSLVLDGSGDYAATPWSQDWNFGTEDFTIDTWIRPTSTASNMSILSQKETGLDSIELRLNAGSGTGLSFMVRNNGNFTVNLQENSTNWQVNTWYHVAVVRKGNTWTLYKNGNAVANAAYAGACNQFTLHGDLMIGKAASGSQWSEYAFFNGAIDELRITKGESLWQGGFTPPSSEYNGVYYAQGSFVSEAIKLDPSRLGSLSWDESIPAGTTVEVRTRTGGTAAPDDGTWGAWSSWGSAHAGTPITSAAASYLQYEIRLSTNNIRAAPVVTLSNNSAIRISYTAPVTATSTRSDIAYVHVTKDGVTAAYDANGVNLVTSSDTIDVATIVYDATEMNVIIDEVKGKRGNLGEILQATMADETLIKDVRYLNGSLAEFAYRRNGYTVRVVNGVFLDATDSLGNIFNYPNEPVGVDEKIFDPAYLEKVIDALDDYRLSDAEKIISLKKGEIVLAELAEVDGKTDGIRAQYRKGGISGYETPDGLTVRDIVVDSSGKVKGCSFTESGTKSVMSGGGISSITDAQGMTTDYYANGFVKSVTLADGTKTEYDYEVFASAQPGLDGSRTQAALTPEGALSLETYADPNVPLLLHFDGANGATASLGSAIRNNQLTFYGGAKIDTAASVFGGSAIKLSNSTSYVSIPDSEDWQLGVSGDFTIDLWANFDSAAGSQTLFSNIQDSFYSGEKWVGWTFSYDASGKLYYFIDDWVVSRSASVNWTPTPGTWYHLALVRSGDTMRFFVNGTLVEGAKSFPYRPTRNSIQYLRIGARGDYAPWYFNGSLDEIRITNGSALWTSNFTPPSSEYNGVYYAQGSFVSEAIKLDPSRLGSLSWDESIPAGTTVEVRTRTGGSASPDDGTWGAWSSWGSAHAGTPITSAAASYLQYEIRLSTNNIRTTPAVAKSNGSLLRINYTAPDTATSTRSDIAYVQMTKNGTTATYNSNGVNLANPSDTLDVATLVYDTAQLTAINAVIETHKLSAQQKVITAFEKGSESVIGTVSANKIVTIFDGSKVMDAIGPHGEKILGYKYDGEDLIGVTLVNARDTLETNYRKAVSEIVTGEGEALGKLAASESDARASIAQQTSGLLAEIASERTRLHAEKATYNAGVYDLSEFERAFADLDMYEANIRAQEAQVYADITSQVADAAERINADASKAMADLVDNDYHRALADIAEKETAPLVYHYYRKILGRDPDTDDLLYWTNLTKAKMQPVEQGAITAYLKGLAEYTERASRKANIIASLGTFFQSYLAATESERVSIISSLGLNQNEIAFLDTAKVSAIMTFLENQSLHFGDSAVESVRSMLTSSGINATFEAICREALKVDILTGVIDAGAKGDLVISLYAMRVVAREYGLDLTSEKVTYDDLKDQVSRNAVTAHIDGKHFVMVKHIDDVKGEVTYTDPTVGSQGEDLTVTRADFMARWKGFALSKELPADPVKKIAISVEKVIRGSGWWSDFWRGIVSFFQQVIQPVATVLMFIPALQPFAMALHGLNIIIQTISFAVGTGTLMDVAWSVISAVGSYVGAQVMTGVFNAAKGVFGSIGQSLSGFFSSTIFAPIQGVFTAVASVLNPAVTGIKTIATGIGFIATLGTASTVEAATTLGLHVISQGVRLGSDYLFQSMHLDPTISTFGSILVNGAFTGIVNPSAGLAASIVKEALTTGAILGANSLATVINIDPRVAQLAGIMAGTLVNGMMDVGGKSLSYTDLVDTIKRNVASESAYIGIQRLGEVMGVDPRISYLAGIGIRSAVNPGIDPITRQPRTIFDGVMNGLMQGVTSVGLNYATQELGISPLLANIGFSAISGAINAGIQAATGKSDDFFGSLFKTYSDSALTFLGYANAPSRGDQQFWTPSADGTQYDFNQTAYDNAWAGYNWQQTAYMANVLNFTDIIKKDGLVSALNTYGASFFNAVAVNQIVQTGYTLGDFFKKKLDTQQYTFTTLSDGTLAAAIDLLDSNNKVVQTALFKEVTNGASSTWALIGKEDLTADGYTLGYGDIGVDAQNKMGYTDAEIKSIFNSDTQLQKIENGQQTYAEVRDSQGNTLLVIEPTADGHYNVYNSYGEYVDAKIASHSEPLTVTLKDGFVASSNSLFGSTFLSDGDIQRLAEYGFTSEDFYGAQLSLSASSDGTISRTLYWSTREQTENVWTKMSQSGIWTNVQERFDNASQWLGFRTNAEIQQHLLSEYQKMSTMGQTGDIIFVNGKGFLANTTKDVTQGPTNHTAILYVDSNGEKWALEMLADTGLQKIKLTEFMTRMVAEGNDIQIGRRNNIDAAAISSTIQQELFKPGTEDAKPIPYNSFNLFGLNERSETSFICSGLIKYVYQKANRPLFVTDQFQYSPVDIYYELDKIGTKY